MRFNIRCDMEGVTGVTSYDQVVPGSRYYEEGRGLLMHDLLAVVEGILSEAPGSEIWIFDEHYQGRNVRVLELPPEARYVSGKPRYTPENPGYIASCQAMFLVGFHAKTGAEGGTLPHTYEHDILDIVVNGTSVGEVGMEAMIAGQFGVPTVFYSGDSAGADELRALIPGVVCVAVKESVSEGAAVCLSGSLTRKLLREGAAEAVRRCRSIEPLRAGEPVEMKIKLRPGPYRRALQGIKPEWFLEPDWVTIAAPNVAEAYAEYWYWKERALAV